MTEDSGFSAPSSSAPNAVQVPMHGHCEICSQPVKAGERFCGSIECEEKHQAFIAAKKKSMWKFVAIMGGLMVFFTALNQGWI
jgi:predicted nucleic acid-binding Zn ribbon protein